jgi:hypothetical protein
MQEGRKEIGNENQVRGKKKQPDPWPTGKIHYMLLVSKFIVSENTT